MKAHGVGIVMSPLQEPLIASNNLVLIKNTELKHALAKFVAELGFKDHEESMDRINN